MIRYAYILGILLFGQSLSAQIITNLSASKDSMEIGDTIYLYYKVQYPPALQLQSVDYRVFDSLNLFDPSTGEISEDSYTEMEWLEPNPDYESKVKKIRGDELIGNQRQTIFNDTISIIPWDFGLLSFRLPVIKFDSVPTTMKQVNTQPTVVLVKVPQLLTQSDSVSLLPIKTIITEEKTFEDYLWILLLLGGLLLLGAIGYFIYKKKGTPDEVIEEVVIKRPSHIIALEKLKDLRGAELWKMGETKKHQSKLTYIIREYLEERFDIKALESTTDEIKYALKEKDLSLEHENNLRQILQIADLVKFAKANPPVDINEEFIGKAERFVEDTKQVIVEQNQIDVQ